MANQSDGRPDPVSAVALLDEPTRRRLYELVAAADEPVGRDQAATTIGISRELAAFHLDRLAAAGLLETVFRRLGMRRGPGAGRPAKLYRRADLDISITLPPRDYRRAATILEDAIAGVNDSIVTGAIVASARATGQAAGAAARTTTGARGGKARRRQALVDLLRDGGYEPATDPSTGSVRLRNCPYHDLAQRHRDVTCGMNLAWADGVVAGLGLAGVEAILAPEPGTCCVVFADATDEPGARQSRACRS
jgi:predicted ArsR family transcriptional regulator